MDICNGVSSSFLKIKDQEEEKYVKVVDEEKMTPFFMLNDNGSQKSLVLILNSEPLICKAYLACYKHIKEIGYKNHENKMAENISEERFNKMCDALAELI